MPSLSSDNGKESKISYMITGAKTEADANRVIPMHNYIKPIIIELLNKHNDYLMYPKNNNADLTQEFYFAFCEYMKSMGMQHIPYECRHTFITLSQDCNMGRFSKKRIVWHKLKDNTDDIYTHTIINRLYKEMHKIKV